MSVQAEHVTAADSMHSGAVLYLSVVLCHLLPGLNALLTIN